ncbi:nickel ABC transporter permease subunit NikC [Campylobacter suis]|uniref:Nickel transport system permease protein NikC n=1 Tax=Campylobacter suis TaxID=2790657 RepID=A0ABM8Q2H0_9BACT|nr:nickel ABC transporter permease subunit NikC [Campylobacter suis]CAD7286947.1 Nickel transport system permease protein NikC [Campylobacter suis]
MKKFGVYFAFFMAFLLIFISIFAHYIVPADVNEVDLLLKFEGISSEHFLGTDHLGRDEFFRLLLATSVSLKAAFLTLFLIIFIGVFIGGVAGFAGGRVDQIFMRICDLFFSVPTLILALFLVGILGVGLTNIIIAIALSHWAWYARIVRSIVLGLKNNEYVMISVTSGASFWQNFKKNMLKPIISQCLVLATLDIGHIILHISGLSFLGLGVKAPTPEWGVMISDAKEYIFSHPELIFYPGFMIFLCVMSFNIIGEYLCEKFDVKHLEHP